MPTKLFGAPVPRRDDDRLLKGQGRYIADIVLPGMLHAAFVRSVHARADIRGIDAAAARSAAGVVEVVTSADLGPAGEPFPQLLPHKGLVSATWSALAAPTTWRKSAGLRRVAAQ